jgi:predicted DNA-binding protein (MmcQ/YjbR family)
MPPSPLSRLRRICLSLPETTEVAAWGEPTFRVRNKIFAMYASADNHHGAGHHAVWLMSTHVNQSLMVQMKPRRFFVPPYTGVAGWVGVRLDGRVNWRELTELVKDAYDLRVAKSKPGKRG